MGWVGLGWEAREPPLLLQYGTIQPCQLPASQARGASVRTHVSHRCGMTQGWSPHSTVQGLGQLHADSILADRCDRYVIDMIDMCLDCHDCSGGCCGYWYDISISVHTICVTHALRAVFLHVNTVLVEILPGRSSLKLIWWGKRIQCLTNKKTARSMTTYAYELHSGSYSQGISGINSLFYFY